MKKKYIVNFNVSRDFSDLESRLDNYGNTNINILLDDFINGKTNWSVSKNAKPGDIIIFLCAKTAKDNLSTALYHAPAGYIKENKDLINQQTALYNQFSGHLLGYGIVSSIPVKDNSSNRWMADIDNLQQFSNPIYFDDFKDFIFIIRGNSVTGINDEQWERLKWTINQKNPIFFPNAKAPDIETLNREFEDKVKKEQAKTLAQLKKEAAKKSSQPSVSTVRTKVYHRDPVIAAYVKKRANGYCQLCGKRAPFNDQNGEPYLECHHIKWISKGGMDSADNCVALCPNCHRKMHILNDSEDLKKLIKSIS